MPRHESCEKKGKKKNRILKYITAGAVIALALLLTVYFFPQISSLAEEEKRESMRSFIVDKGAVGVFMMLGLQMLQIILSVIPGEPVEVMFGFIYGPWLGALLCLFGMALASFFVFSITKMLGKNYMKKAEQSEKYQKLNFLKDPRKRDILIFILFFIPGTPKDTITYFAPFTKIDAGKFLLLSTVARIPSVITSTFAGESIFTGDYLDSVIIFAVTGVVGIAGILIYNYILRKNEGASKPLADENDE